MAFKTIEEAIIETLINDADIKIILGSNANRKVFVSFMRTQLINSKQLKFPNISVSISYGPAEPAIPAMNGVATITMEFKELGDALIPILYASLSFLKEKILNALAKIDFSLGDLTVNHFLLQGGSEPIFILQDKVWQWPLIFNFVHRDNVTVGRVGVEVP